MHIQKKIHFSFKYQALDLNKFCEIFLPALHKKQQDIQKKSTRLVHYCRAEAAKSILEKNKFWMRNSKCMNDYQEMQHGLKCLVKAWGGKDNPTPLKTIIDEIFPSLTSKIEDNFNGWSTSFESGTFISCFSEHDNDEDELGRLSMWRGYGKSVGVAIVMNNEPFFSGDDDWNGIYTHHVEYQGDEGVKKQLDTIAENIKQNKDYVESLGADFVFDSIFIMLRLIMACTKHPGFKEEKEWRVIYSPEFDENTAITKEIEVINSTPQEVYKIPLKTDKNETDDKGKIKTAILMSELIDRIIIGPAEHPVAVRNAFIALLKRANIPNAESKVFISQIPLRT